MKHRLIDILVLSVISTLVLAPAALADEGLSNNEIGLIIGIGIIAVSGLIMRYTSTFFARKRQANARKNRARAKSKRKR